MRALDLDVEPISPGGPESQRLNGETPQEYVVRLALGKTRQVAALLAGATVLGADTVVVVDGDILGKPSDACEATGMLRRLRGRAHAVVTGVTAMGGPAGRSHSIAKETRVVMRDYSDEELAAYVESGAALDKAGAYGVQDGPFHPALETHGCYLNVVGLPLCEVVPLLGEFGVQARLRPGWRPPPPCGECPLKPCGESGTP